MAIAKTVAEHLARAGISYELVPHPRTYSARDAAGAAHVPEDRIAKAVVLRDEQGRFLAVVIPGSHWLKRRSVEHELGRGLAMASESDVDILFPDCAPGAVPPMAFAYGLETLVDEQLATLADVYFEAGDHEQLVHLGGEQFHAVFNGQRHGYYSHPG